MIDCKVTENYISEKARMCKVTQCIGCKLKFGNNGTFRACNDFEKENIEKAIEYVQEWSDEHTQKTFLDDIKEQFPKFNEAVLDIRFCVNTIYAAGEKLDCFNKKCIDCWSKPIPKRILAELEEARKECRE